MHCTFLNLLAASTQARSRPGEIVLLILGVGLVLLSLYPPFRRMFWKPAESPEAPATDADAIEPFAPRRLVAAYIAIAIIFVGSVADLLRDTEHWPWSNFPMYSELEPIADHFEDFRIYGVRADDSTKEIALFNDGRYLQPFDPSRLEECLWKFHGTSKIEPALLDCLKRYESLRVAGMHDGPQIVGIRLYYETRHIDPMGGNVDAIPPAQDRQLLNQVWLPTPEKKS